MSGQGPPSLADSQGVGWARGATMEGLFFDKFSFLEIWAQMLSSSFNFVNIWSLKAWLVFFAGQKPFWL
jgi:hypothetical protein